MADLLAGVHPADLANPILIGLLVAGVLGLAVLVWRGPRLLALAVAVLVLGSGLAFALRPATVTMGGTTLRIEGPIRPSTVDEVARLLPSTGYLKVELRSSFGISSIEAARRLADLLRERQVVTTPIGLCTSACAILYLAGVERELPSDPAALNARLVFGPGVDWTAELRRVGAPEAFAIDAGRRAATGRGFASPELVGANVVTHVRAGGSSFVCVQQPGDALVRALATEQPGRSTWQTRVMSPYGGSCGAFVRLDGAAGRFDLRLELAGGESRLCRDVVLRGVGDVLSFSVADGTSLHIDRRNVLSGGAPDEIRRETVRCA